MTAPLTAAAPARASCAALVCLLLASTAAYAAPPIRTGADNQVPACVSPDRLMAFLRTRNEDLDPRYRDIARWYKHYGEAWNVRWDYAFYQMVLETNYLMYRRGNGRRGDVHEKQNNFAGIGATGGGVAGERFPDIKTGVHAQIQHLVAYSGERVASPVARRTTENQDDIIAKSRRLGRPVTFGDLARRWATDRAYAKSIDVVAGMFRDGHCHGPAPAQAAEGNPVIQTAQLAAASRLGGPKPQKLAGPETLPWEDSTAVAAPRAAQSDDAPAADEPAAAKQPSGPPVRTLWSRDKGGKSVPPKPDATGTAPAPQVQQAARPARPEPAAVVNEPASEPETAAGEAIELPEFRIAPRRSEPSKLGGPVPGAADSSVSATALSVPGEFTLPRPAVRNTPQNQLKTITAAQQDATTGDCRIITASYGGRKTLLVHAEKNGALQLTALTVLDGFEQSMFESYAKARAPSATVIGTFDSKDEALTQAKAICPSG